MQDQLEIVRVQLIISGVIGLMITGGILVVLHGRYSGPTTWLFETAILLGAWPLAVISEEFLRKTTSGARSQTIGAILGSLWLSGWAIQLTGWSVMTFCILAGVILWILLSRVIPAEYS
jgi:hypothetical protein